MERRAQGIYDKVCDEGASVSGSCRRWVGVEGGSQSVRVAASDDATYIDGELREETQDAPGFRD